MNREGYINECLRQLQNTRFWVKSKIVRLSVFMRNRLILSSMFSPLYITLNVDTDACLYITSEIVFVYIY